MSTVNRTSSVRKKELEKELQRILPVLKKKYKPEKVILFGSVARGKVGPWSDLDLAIIKKTKRRFLDRVLDVTKLVNPKRAIDIVVYTPEEFGILQKEGRYFISEILSGKILYDAKK